MTIAHTKGRPGLSTRDLAERFGVGEGTIINWAERGRLPRPIPHPGVRHRRWDETAIQLWERAVGIVHNLDGELQTLLADGIPDKTAKEVAETTRAILGHLETDPLVRAVVASLVGRMNLDKSDRWSANDKNRARRILIQLVQLHSEITALDDCDPATGEPMK